MGFFKSQQPQRKLSCMYFQIEEELVIEKNTTSVFLIFIHSKCTFVFLDSDKENLEIETLEKQYRIVKRETNTSMVCQFGDMSISKMKVAWFQGESTQEDSFISFVSEKDANLKHGYFSYTNIR